MNNVKKISTDPLTGFASLHAAIIDSSSIIYMVKSGFLHLAAQQIRLHTPIIVIKETATTETFFEIHKTGNELTTVSADEQVVQLSLTLKMPAISEDKKILSRISGAGISYYNALMILNFLLYKQAVSTDQYEKLYAQLISVARYSNFVISYGEMVKKRILEMR